MSVSTETGNFEEVRKAVDLLNSRAGATDQFMKGITLLLNEKMLKYNWVGFYMIDAESSPPMLVLGYYQGAPSPHTRIPLHEGICGAAASSGNPQAQAAVPTCQGQEIALVKEIGASQQPGGSQRLPLETIANTPQR